MSKRQDLPKASQLILPRGISFDVPPVALARWNGTLAAKEAEQEKDNTISIYDPIGFDPWTGAGVTAKRIAAALRAIGKGDVVVNINSPGGDLFEGIAIYNLLRDHDGEVTTRVIGIAASAASVIAMAGDKIQHARAGFTMIHNCMIIAMGNRHDLRDAADTIETFDGALADIYAARTGKDPKECAKLMDRETWFSGAQAIEQGFADELLPEDAVEEKERDKGAKASLALVIRNLESACMHGGKSRTSAREHINLLKELLIGKPDAADRPQDRSTPDAAPKAMPDAGEVEAKAKSLVDSFTESLQT